MTLAANPGRPARSAAAGAPKRGKAHGACPDRSRQIVAAAYELLDAGGLDGLTIRGVLEKAGLSRRAFYERFAGKDELLLAVFEQTIKLAAAHYSVQVASLPDPMVRLQTIVTGIVLGRSALPDNRGKAAGRLGAAMSREHLHLAESRPQDLQTALRPLMTLLAEQIAGGIQAGQMRADAPPLLAALVYNLVSTTVHTELLAQETAAPDPARRARLASSIWEFCRRAVAA